MTARHRSTEPVAVRMHKAKLALEQSRAQIDAGRPVVALWNIMQALLHLERAEVRLNAITD